MYPSDLQDIENAVRRVTTGLDPEVWSGSDAQVAMERFARIEKMARAGARLMGKRVADTNVWRNRGRESGGHALADALGCTVGEAKKELDTARKLDHLPAADQAARNGELSAGQTGDVAGAASADAGAEQELLDLARTASASELHEEARRRRHAAAADDAQRRRRIVRNRSLRMGTDDDGAATLFWSHLPEVGAEVGAILDPYIEEIFHAARRSGIREPRDRYAADAFVNVMRDAAAFRRGETLDDAEHLDGTEHRQPTRGSASRHRSTDAGPRPGAATTDERVDRGRAERPTRPSSNGADPSPGDAPPPWTGPPPSVDLTDDLAGAAAAAGDGRSVTKLGSAAAAASSHPPDPPSGSRRSTVTDPRHRAATHDPPTASGAATASADDRDGDSDVLDAATPGRSRRWKVRRRGADAKVIIRIDYTALQRGHTEAGEVCEIAGLGPVPVGSVTELMDDAFLAAVILKGRDVHTVAHLGRQPSAFQLTALQAQPQQCTTLGCPNRARLENDHRDPWCDTHETRLRGLDPSCGHCHDLKTFHGFRHTPGTGVRPLLSPGEQAEWNREHPDDPIAALDPPGRRGPNGAATHAATTTSATSQPGADHPARRTGPPRPEALTLDL